MCLNVHIRPHVIQTILFLHIFIQYYNLKPLHSGLSSYNSFLAAVFNSVLLIRHIFSVHFPIKVD